MKRNLIALGMVSLCFAIGDLGWGWLRLRWNVPVAVLVCALLFTLNLSRRGIRKILDQQYQMGLFLHQHFPRATVVVNDLGAVSLEAAEAFFHHEYSPDWLRDWAAREDALRQFRNRHPQGLTQAGISGTNPGERDSN